MRRIILGIALATQLAGCASTHKSRAAQLVIISDATADEIAASWDTFVEAEIGECREELGAESTPEKRKGCLGIAADGEILEAAVQTLIASQAAIKEGVKCEELKTCADEVDWKALVAEITGAWTALKPFVTAAKGSN